MAVATSLVSRKPGTSSTRIRDPITTETVPKRPSSRSSSSVLTPWTTARKHQPGPGGRGDMPWWGSQSLASTFASQISTQLGFPNGTDGPNFAYQTQENLGDIYVDSRAFIQSLGTEDQSVNRDSTSATYATATPVPAAVPGPLPIFGAAAAFGMSRRLRYRILLNG